MSAAAKVTALAVARTPKSAARLPSGAYTPEFKREVAAYATKHGATATAKAYGLNNGRVWQMQRFAQGLPLKKTEEEGGKSRSKYPAAYKAEVVAYAKANGGTRAAASKFGISYHAAYGMIRAADGLPAGGHARRDFGSVKTGKTNFVATWHDNGKQRKKRGFPTAEAADQFLDTVRPDEVIPPRAISRRRALDGDLVTAGEAHMEAQGLREENEKLWELVELIRRRRR